MDKNESRSLYSSSPSSRQRLHEQSVNIKKAERYIKNIQNKNIKSRMVWRISGKGFLLSIKALSRRLKS